MMVGSSSFSGPHFCLSSRERLPVRGELQVLIFFNTILVLVNPRGACSGGVTVVVLFDLARRSEVGSEVCARKS